MTSSTSPLQLPTWYDYLLDPKITQGSLPRPLAPSLSICCSYTSQRSPLSCHIFSQPVSPLWTPFLHIRTTFLYWSCKLLCHHDPQFICIPIILPLTIRQNLHLEQYGNSSLLLLCKRKKKTNQRRRKEKWSGEREDGRGKKAREGRKWRRKRQREEKITSPWRQLGSFMIYQSSSFPLPPKTILDLHNSLKLMPHSQQLNYFSCDFSIASTWPN